MEFSAEQIAGILNGEILGDAEVKVNDLAKIEEGKKEHSVFYLIQNTKSIFILQAQVFAS